jgi:beta-glucanase (GH16 family)
MKVNTLTAGQHFTWWLLPIDGSWPPEIDIIELVGSNRSRPNGPMDMLFFNGHGSNGGPGINWVDVASDFLGRFHEYEFIWDREQMIWLVDGVEYRRQVNYINKPMYILGSWEIGSSPNGDFPGPLNNSSKWPAEVEIDYVKVTID